MIREASRDDVPAITAILNSRIATDTSEWREELHELSAKEAWFAACRDRGWPVLIAEVDGDVAGFATYDDFRDSLYRPGYRFVVENSVHVAEAHLGAGLGRTLMVELIARARAADLRSMVAAIDGANSGSVTFHERLGR